MRSTAAAGSTSSQCSDAAGDLQIAQQACTDLHHQQQLPPGPGLRQSHPSAHGPAVSLARAVQQQQQRWTQVHHWVALQQPCLAVDHRCLAPSGLEALQEEYHPHQPPGFLQRGGMGINRAAA